MSYLDRVGLADQLFFFQLALSMSNQLIINT